MRNEFEWKWDKWRIRQIMKKNRKQGVTKIDLFLDFDGVINVFLLPGTEKYEEKAKQEVFEFADRACVKRVSDLCLEKDCRIIISSSWRFAGLDYCRDYLYKAGMDERVEIADVTESDAFRARDEEIMDYLLSHQDFAGFLIFDDGRMPNLPEYEILTDPTVGYDESQDQKARAMIEAMLKG